MVVEDFRLGWQPTVNIKEERERCSGDKGLIWGKTVEEKKNE